MFVATQYTHNIKPALLLTAVVIGCSCLFMCRQNKKQRTIEPAFYYWKSVLNISLQQQQVLDSLHVKTLYIKFFDAAWDAATHQPVPVAKLQAANYTLPYKYNIIPTVFITNECIQKIDDSVQITQLAANVYTLIQNIIAANNFSPVKEIQIDCDWTATTKKKYFLLLEKIKAQWKNIVMPVSATIRLHQIKFMSKTGVPPVDKGLLMCYNMGNLKNPATNNSILETTELEKYTALLNKYPLPLDVALPLFDWKVLFRNNVYTGLVEGLPASLLTAHITLHYKNRYTFLKDTVLAGYSFKKGDVLRDEPSEFEEIKKAGLSISQQLKNSSLRVSLYHLDSVILKKYSLYELETLYNSLR